MSFDMNKRDDEWLDFALQQKPEIKDDGFSASFLARLEAQARRRRQLLAAVLLVDFLVVALIVPWTSLFNWLTKGAMMTTKLTPELPNQSLEINWANMPVMGALIILTIGLATVFLARDS